MSSSPPRSRSRDSSRRGPADKGAISSSRTSSARDRFSPRRTSSPRSPSWRDGATPWASFSSSWPPSSCRPSSTEPRRASDRCSRSPSPSTGRRPLLAARLGALHGRARRLPRGGTGARPDEQGHHRSPRRDAVPPPARPAPMGDGDVSPHEAPLRRRAAEACRASRGRARAAGPRGGRRTSSARIARELHDVVAHSLCVMVVQAEAAEAIARERPGRGPAARCSAIAATGRQALTEMRRLLGVLRTDDASPALAPAAGPAPARRARRGRPRGRARRSTLTVEGAAPAAAGRRRPVRLPDRAGGAHQRAQARAGRRTSTVRAALPAGRAGARRSTRRRRSARRRPPTSGGHGLVGMRERVGLYGGPLDAGRRRGGFGVRARYRCGRQGRADRSGVVLADDQQLVRAGLRADHRRRSRTSRSSARRRTAPRRSSRRARRGPTSS